LIIALVRHPESTKNLILSFASSEGLESLTENGLAQLSSIEAAMREVKEFVPSARFQLYSADSVRAAAVGTRLAIALALEEIVMPNLGSVRSGQLAGVPEHIARSTHAEYFRKLALYRAGAFSSYDLDSPGESTHLFETRIAQALARIEADGPDFAVVAAHKSSITASVIAYARRFHKYPRDFFGFVDVPTASISVVQVDEQGGRIWGVGEPVESALDTIKLALNVEQA
jgi:broad specificity phosphatase PhoE